MSIAVKGIYRKGKVKLLEKLEDVEVAEVVIVVVKEKREKKKKEYLTTKVIDALKEVKLMREEELPEIDARKILNEI